MSYQNINQYNFKKIGFRPVNEVIDISLVSDELNFDEETIFSSKLIAEDDGNRMPFNFDFAYSANSICISCGDFSKDVILSKNYYNPEKVDLLVNQSTSSICDVGLTGIDNGLTNVITGQTIEINSGLYTLNTDKFSRYKYDKKLKLHPITGFTTTSNRIVNDNSYTYTITSATTESIGTYVSLNGGFYQGFYKLFGYDYEIFPERPNLGWTAEFLLKYRWTGDTAVGLNARYPENTGMFFYLGARAENKFYHYADGESPYSGYSRVTSGLTCLDTCRCNDTYSGATFSASSCNNAYQITGITNTTGDIIFPEKNVFYDDVSNSLSIQLSGNSGNPKICVKTYTITGSCETTGATINNWCSTKGIFEDFKNTNYVLKENWVQIDVVFVRDRLLDSCDLKDLGGLGLLVSSEYTASTSGRSVELIQPPTTQSGNTPTSIEVVNFDSRWFESKKYREGNLRIYINGKPFFIIDNFEEIIPRQLNTIKETQVGVPFNISWGGGTQGLKDALTFSSCTSNDLIQDPELLPTTILNNTIYSGLTTNIILEKLFGGNFIGDLSAFRMYIEPLDAGQIRHNFRILKDKYGLIDPFNPDKEPVIVITPSVSNSPTPTPTITPSVTTSTVSTPTQTPTPTTTPSITPTITPSITPTITPSITPTTTLSITPTMTLTPTITPTPSNIPYYAYVFAEPQTFEDGVNLENYMVIDNGKGWGGYQFYGIPSTNDYSSTLDVYAHYSGWTSNTGNYITPPMSIKSPIKQTSAPSTDTFGCPQNQYTFGTVEILKTQVNENIKYFYSIWLPIDGLGGTFTNMTIDAGTSACSTDYVNDAIPDSIAIQNVTITSGAAIPAGNYRVLWLQNLTLPITQTLLTNIYIKGEIKT
jgi:hypothetical protein